MEKEKNYSDLIKSVIYDKEKSFIINIKSNRIKFLLKTLNVI